MGGGYLSARVLPLLPARSPCFASLCGTENSVCAGAAPERGFPGSGAPERTVGWAPPQLRLSFPAYFGAASLGVKDLGRGEGIRVSKLHPQMCVGLFRRLSSLHVAPVLILMVQRQGPWLGAGGRGAGGRGAGGGQGAGKLSAVRLAVVSL